LYAHTGHEDRLLCLRKWGDPEILAEFRDGAWFAGIARIADILAYATDDGTMIRFLRPVKTVMTEGQTRD
jgi:hypothetical protein